MTCLFRSALLLCLLGSGAVALADARLDRLRADWAALQDASHDFAQRGATLSPQEAGDYRAYIERLRGRLAGGCAALAAAGIAVPPEIVCPQAMPRSAPADIDQHAEQTRTETTSTLDAELNAGLGAFDQRLLREQERIKAKASTGAGGGAAGSAGGTGEESAAGTGQAATAGTTGAEPASERPPAAAGGPGSPQTVREPPPPGTPDGRDDDVVARQLREAAEKESDPELKKKLWDEYRRYKQGVR